MLAEWNTMPNTHDLFIINERWGIRKNTVRSAPSVLVHRCSTGGVGNIHDLVRNDYECDTCKTPIPDEIQALWLLRTCDEADEYWMKHWEK